MTEIPTGNATISIIAVSTLFKPIARGVWQKSASPKMKMEMLTKADVALLTC